MEIAKRPDPEHLVAWAELQARTKPPDAVIIRAFGTLNYLLLPAMLAVGEAHLRYRATIGSALAIVAAERQRIAHGSRPDSVDSLDPKFAEGLIDDPYVGGPLKFKPEAGRLVIYSVNQDGKDDGGKLDDKRKPRPGTDWGLTWWNPEARRRPSLHELPTNVFQAPRRGDQEDPIE